MKKVLAVEPQEVHHVLNSTKSIQVFFQASLKLSMQSKHMVHILCVSKLANITVIYDSTSVSCGQHENYNNTNTKKKKISHFHRCNTKNKELIKMNPLRASMQVSFY